MSNEVTTQDPPKRLKGAAKRKWVEMAPHVELDSPFAVDALAQYCDQYAVYELAQSELSGLTSTTLMQTNTMQGEHPAIKTAKDASVQMRLIRDTLVIKTKDTDNDW